MPADEITLPLDVAQPTGFLHTLLTMSLTAVAVLRPVYDPVSASIRDFAWVCLNPAGQRMLQQPQRPESSLLTLFPTAQTDGVFAKCCLAFETGELQRNQTNYQADGLDGYFLLVAQRYEQLLVVNFTDTNEQPRTPVEQALRESQAREQVSRAQAEEILRTTEQQRVLLQQVLGLLPAYVATFSGPDYVYSYFNEAFSQVLTQNRARLGLRFADLFPETVAQGFLAILDQVYRSGKPMQLTEAKVIHRDPVTNQENLNYINIGYLPLLDEQGQTQHVLGFGVDVTEQVQARQALGELNQQLEQRVAESTQQLRTANEGLEIANSRLRHVNADLDTFVYTASHDLRTPISNLEGLVAAMRQELLDEPIIKRDVEFILKLMGDSVTRFQTTLGHLTDIMHVQQDTNKRWQPVDLTTLVADIKLDLAPQLAATHGELLVDVAACPRLYSSPKDVRSILFNLLSNALKYYAPDRAPRVHLRASCDAQWAELQVQDNGLGLSSEQQSRLFGLFTRLHNHVEGSGVGLYTIKKLVENHGGTIVVESALGRGSTFTVRLPLPVK